MAICYLRLIMLAAGEYSISQENVYFSKQPHVSIETIGKSLNSNPIQSIHLSLNLTQNCLILGAISGNVFATSQLVFTIAKTFLNTQETLNCNIWFIPITNIDGYIKSRESGIEVTKNRRKTDCKSDILDGIDLNRNFYTAIGFGTGIPCEDSYQGELPASEPETRSILHLIDNEDIHLIIAFVGKGKEYTIPEA